ncbi:uncharacterized protein TNIN_100031 [Trichonephila inaurata madagascariensis]|uniref:Uncharacterized protein n=1 Tax=Trichonephila inaurata madagascariensis TaxID=2747483 RepID=A0A8X6X3W7_9ARAC|nr:uncharacterized protein TNIN_100031 [Trichonephila inaurata madagascariensis]
MQYCLCFRCCCGALMCNHPASATQGLYRAHSVHSQASSQASADEHWSPLRHTASNPTDAFGTIEFQGSAHPLKAQVRHKGIYSNGGLYRSSKECQKDLMCTCV